MCAQTNVAPVIIKRKKVVSADGHHGGAWKVAYADFVTAMMAFFMLMWLLNATTEKQRKGIADYFSPTVAISRVSGGGDGMFGGDSVFSEMTLPQNGTGATNLRPTESHQARGEFGMSDQGADAYREAEMESFRALDSMLIGGGGESMASIELQRHIITRVTDEGLVVELFDLPDAALFEAGTDEPTALLRDMSDMMVRVFSLVTNNLSVEGHTRAHPIVLTNNPVWSLSAGRADRMRVLLEHSGLDRMRVRRITGHADRKPAVRDPMADRNNRLEVILLRRIK